MKAIWINNRPHLCLFALTDINFNEEVTYSYGDDSDCLFPWRSSSAPDESLNSPVTQTGELCTVQCTTIQPTETVDHTSEVDRLHVRAAILQHVGEQLEETVDFVPEIGLEATAAYEVVTSHQMAITFSRPTICIKAPIVRKVAPSDQLDQDDTRMDRMDGVLEELSVDILEDGINMHVDLMDLTNQLSDEMDRISSSSIGNGCNGNAEGGLEEDLMELTKRLNDELHGDGDSNARMNSQTVHHETECTAAMNEVSLEAEAVEKDVTDADENYYTDKTGKFKIPRMKKTATHKGKQKKSPRLRNTLHACIFCQEDFTNISKHIRTHKTEPSVIEIMDLEKKSKSTEDKQAKAEMEHTISNQMDMLRQKGDDQHNSDVKARGEGILYIARRHNKLENFDIEDFVTCTECYLWLHTKSNMSEHTKICIGRKPMAHRGKRRTSAKMSTETHKT